MRREVELFSETPVFRPEGAAEASKHVHDAVVVEGGSIDGLWDVGCWGKEGGVVS